MKYALALLILFNVGCGHESARPVSAIENMNGTVNSSPSEGSTSASGAQARSIRDVNFYSLTYHWYPKWEYMLSEKREFTLRNGRMEVDVPRGSNEPAAFELLNIQYGDVTGDNVEEAVIIIKMDVMGNSKPYVVFVYTPTNGEPKMLWVHESGDRADKGLRRAYITNDHLLAIEEYNADKIVSDSGEITEVGMCCPRTFTRTFYRWQQGSFRKSREETQPNDYRDAKVLVGPASASD